MTRKAFSLDLADARRIIAAIILSDFKTMATRGSLPVHSLIHSGLFQAASASRKTLSRKGKNFRLE
jgi:hypothetical protein